MKKNILIFIMMISMTLINNVSINGVENTNYNALSNSGGLNYTFSQTFIDKNLAKFVANSLGKSVNETITQNDINRTMSLSATNSEITDISGIEYFTSLKTLILDNNSISIIPDSISKLTNLKELSFKKNKIEYIPSTIEYLTYLNYFDLTSNQVSVIPNSITKLSNLRILYLNNNKISEIPENIGDLTSLSYFLLANNNITIIPPSIGNLSNLDTLHLYGNHISTIPQTIKKLRNLSSFYISSQKINLKPQYYNSQVKTNNIIKDSDDKYIAPSEISNNGFYDTVNNTIQWNQLSNENQIINYSFSKQIIINNKYVDFNGIVFQPIQLTKNIETATTEFEDSFSFNGEIQTPSITLFDGLETLLLNTDYTLEYSNNINAGQGKIVISGLNTYTGEKIVYFTIKQVLPEISKLPEIIEVSKNTKLSSVPISKGIILGIDNIELEGSFNWDNPDQIITITDEYPISFIPNDSNYTELKFNVKVVVLAEEENQTNNDLKKPHNNNNNNNNLVQDKSTIINGKDLSKTGISIILPMILFLSTLILVYFRKNNKKNNN